MFGVIGGSGFERFEEFTIIKEMPRETPFGLAASGFKKVSVNGNEFLFMSRHGEHHEHLPSEVNYRANIFALKALGAKAILSFSAVGSLQQSLAPGDLVIPFQYIDRTKSLRSHTFLGQGLIGHVSLAKPICEVMAHLVAPKAQNLVPSKNSKELQSHQVHIGKTYVCIEGPYFSTKAESNSFRQLGADIVGMSNFPEYALAREAGLPYLPCCWVTDYDCWDDSIPHVTVQEVIRVMRGNNSKAFSLLKEVLESGPLWEGSLAPEGGLRNSLFMPIEAVPSDKKKWLEVLMR